MTWTKSAKKEKDAEGCADTTEKDFDHVRLDEMYHGSDNMGAKRSNYDYILSFLNVGAAYTWRVLRMRGAPMVLKVDEGRRNE